MGLAALRAMAVAVLQDAAVDVKHHTATRRHEPRNMRSPAAYPKATGLLDRGGGTSSAWGCSHGFCASIAQRNDSPNSPLSALCGTIWRKLMIRSGPAQISRSRASV